MLIAIAVLVSGTVFADGDGDGVRGEGEKGVATVVAWEDRVFARTAADGRFELEVPEEGGLVWARAPDGYRPGPAWAEAGSGVEIGVVPYRRAEGDGVTFVVASDAHVHDEAPKYAGPAELDAVLAQALAGEPAPAFVALLGDLTQSTQPTELDEIDRATRDLAVPRVLVAGNHDWYDLGLEWRARFGPATYSFDVGEVHVVVADSNEPGGIADFVERELAFVDAARTVVVMAHHPQPAGAIARMKEAGVDLFLAGHWHIDREVDHGGLLEIETGPLVMGGMDATPAHYRTVTIRGGAIRTARHDVVRAPWLRLVAPIAPRCAVEGTSLIVAAAIDARTPTVTARIDGRTIELAAAGGWAHLVPLPKLRVGRHRVRLEAGGVVTDAEIVVCDPEERALDIDAWPQPGGDATHRGRQERAIAPPLVERWAAAVGGRVVGAPVSDGTRVFVAVGADGGDVEGGGALVALDARTGAARWRVATARAVRNAPVVVGDAVIVVDEGGVALALDAASGAERWRRDLGAGLDPLDATALSPPAAADGVVYAGGHRHFAALDAATGTERWSIDAVPDATWRFTMSAPAVAGDRVIATLERSRGGLFAWTRDGVQKWRLPAALMYSTDAAPVIDGGVVYVASGTGDLLALDAADGTLLWYRLLTDDHHSWAYAIRGTPAIAGDTIVVATEHKRIWALDAATGDGRWTWSAGESPLYAAHYQTRSGGFAASPVITGDVVWAATTDGTLVGLDLATGAVRQRIALGAPVLAGLAAAGDLLIVAGWDGTVHAFATGEPPARPAPRPPVLEIAVGLLIAISVALRLRRARSATR